MKKLTVSLENCYGIKKFEAEFDLNPSKYGPQRSKAIYAPNGAMKTSLAKTFKDLSLGRQSVDLIFPDRVSKRSIVLEDGSELQSPNVFVIEPMDEEYKSDKMSTLLVNKALREEYESIYEVINEKKEALLKELRLLSGLKKGIEEEITTALSDNSKDFRLAIMNVHFSVGENSNEDFTDVDYKILFDEKVEQALSNPDIRNNLAEFIARYDELISRSRFFRKGIFTHNNANNIAKELAKNGFFKAKHKVYLASQNEQVTVETEDQLIKVIEEEKERILSDQTMKDLFEKVDSGLMKNMQLQAFRGLIEKVPSLISYLSDLKTLKRSVWIFYLRKARTLYEDLASAYNNGRTAIQRIELEAKKESGDWYDVVGIFSKRFSVPFQLFVDNQTDVLLNSDLPKLGFVFQEKNSPTVTVKRESLLSVLSTGEKRALYILNIIFEVEARKKAKQPTLFVIDDIADSFDYKNKYAIIEYLRDINKEDFFFQILLTHNFDFFRTLASRFVRTPNCSMVKKSDDKIELVACPEFDILKYLRNNIDKDERVFIASIPFARNLAEYAKGNSNPNFKRLTSVLHHKKDSNSITVEDLISIYEEELHIEKANFESFDKTKLVVDLIDSVASKTLSENEESGVNLENKISLAIAIRLKAERIMIKILNSADDVEAIKSNQTGKLFDLLKDKFAENDLLLSLFERVILMTPESIHLNSFMYEPIVDMADEHLKVLYKDLLDYEAEINA